MRTRRAAAFAALAGVLTAASLPPFGLWWLAPLGYAGLIHALADQPRRPRFATAAVFFLAYFCIGLAWCVEFSVPGAVLLVVLETLLAAACVTIAPRPVIGLPAVLVLAEMIRYRFPLGGLPMAGPALGQVDGPLLPLARTGGDFLVLLVVVGLGAAIAKREWRVLAGLVVIVALAHAVPVPRATGPLRVAYVQGGGVRGLRAVENTVTDVYGNQLSANATRAHPR